MHSSEHPSARLKQRRNLHQLKKMDDACVHVNQLSSEVRRLELEISKSAMPMHVSPSKNSVQKMAEALQGVLSEMQNSGFVPIDVLSRAQSSMTMLYNDVVAVANAANNQAAACATEPTHPPPPPTMISTPAATGRARPARAPRPHRRTRH